ncbi:SigB/SigF/SigG family RNA polymerase sigma factor [Phytoactinopolyspora halotolerans]|uniref:SigB/SigF/SigG family RNA polymerase sigma factor n=2 Tax=Phytoactinopolyspora halotolerans TaxID=1981512 RepID=A0A6L9S1H1_9ACTN|nr:SigB/SigF/SigG family RNA polymerase sigma factor [Phytoactinopolyspora halotolerans]
MTTPRRSNHTSNRDDGDRVELTHRLLKEAAAAPDDEERRRLQDEVIVLNTGLAESIARRYAKRSEEQSDVTQVAYVGLVNAVRRFAPDRGIDFISFAMPTITGEIKRFFRDQGWTVRPPRRIQDLHRQITAATSHLSQTLGRSPSPEELADHLGEEVADVNEALSCRSCYTPVSIDAPTRTEEGTSLSDLLGADDGNFDRSEATTALQPLCRELPERDKRILYLRFFHGWTQQEIAQELGVTQMQVSRLLARILGHLRTRLGSLEAGDGHVKGRREASGSQPAARRRRAA